MRRRAQLFRVRRYRFFGLWKTLWNGVRRQGRRARVRPRFLDRIRLGRQGRTPARYRDLE